MSKISQYLNEHILGEVTSSDAIREAFSVDASILRIKPELVIFPRVTNDIRKATRFTWQLAEKGHILPITTRGGGTDQTGASIGKGVIINTTAHLNNVIYLGLKDKDKFVHVQPGVTFKSLNDLLQSHGSYVPSYPDSQAYSTIGGAVANNSAGQLSGRYGATGEWVSRLEVVLANGDLLETSRINKRDLNKKKGLQTFEGEIYRKIDGLIEDNIQVITDKIDPNVRDNTGYHGITQVKQKDGSFDLTPLFVGSQGTLGIISEVVLKTEFYSNDESIIVATFDSMEAVRDAADSMRQLQPNSLEIFDGEFFNIARDSGKKYPFSDAQTDTIGINAVLYVSFNDFADHARTKKLKRAVKLIDKLDGRSFTSEDYSTEELSGVRNVSSAIFISESKDLAAVPLLDGASIAKERIEDFSQGVKDLAEKHHVSLPLHIRSLDGVIYTRPILDLQKVGDKQKVFKLISDYTDLVYKSNGSIFADSAEGRLRANATYEKVDEELLNLFNEIRNVFDPYGTLNPGVKQKTEIHSLAQSIRSSYDLSQFQNNISSN